MVSALRSSNLRLYLFGAFFALNGLWMQRVTLAWLAWSLTGAAGWVGAVAAALYAPTLVVGPLFGVLADRIDLRRGALAAQTVQAVLTLGLYLLWSAGALDERGVFACALALGLAASAHHPIRMALLPRLAPAGTLAQAVALGSVNFNMSRMIGPAVAGALLAFWTAEAALIASMLCFLPFIAVLLAMRIDAAARGPSKPWLRGFGADLGEGLRIAARNPTIRLAFFGTAAFALVARAPLEITAAIADGGFGRGAQGLGEATAAAGAGALAASLGLSFRKGEGADPLLRIGAAALFGAGLLGLALSAAESWIAALGVFAALGFCAAAAGVAFQSAVQLSLEDGRRGRVMSLWTQIGIGGAALGAALLGAAADAVGLRPALAGLGAAGLLGVALFWLARSRIRRFDARPRPRHCAPEPLRAEEPDSKETPL